MQLTWDIPAVPNGVIKAYIASYGLKEDDSVVSEIKVDGDSRSLILPVFGGKTYWFRVKALAIKEGIYSPKHVVSVHAYSKYSKDR